MIHQALLAVEGLEQAQIVRLEGREAMNELGGFTVDLLTEDARLDPARLVGKSATLGLAGMSGEQTRWHGIVLGAAHRGHVQGRERLRCTLGPIAASLRLRVDYAVFQEKTTQQIVAELLQRAGIAGAMVQWRLAGRYAQRVYTVQHGESDWDFLSRLLADEGINTWFDGEGDEPRWVFGDHPSSHEGIEGESPLVRFEDASGLVGSTGAFHALRRRSTLTSTRVALREVDVQRPDLPIDGEAGEGALELFDYPSSLTLPEAARARAEVRLQQARRHRHLLTGESANPHLRPGRVVEITGAADEVFNGRFLITAVEHRLVEASRNDGSGRPYGNQVTMVPFADDLPHRPPVPEKRPVVRGLTSAIVTGPPGEEIHVDDLGRVKVRFFWDRSGVHDDTSSRWVRTLQMNLAAPQVLPRVGWEVPIVYENGDPDRPFVLGRLYNGGAPPPLWTAGHQGHEHPAIGHLPARRHDPGDPFGRRRRPRGGLCPRDQRSERLRRWLAHRRRRWQSQRRRKKEPIAPGRRVPNHPGGRPSKGHRRRRRSRGREGQPRRERGRQRSHRCHGHLRPHGQRGLCRAGGQLLQPSLQPRPHHRPRRLHAGHRRGPLPHCRPREQPIRRRRAHRVRRRSEGICRGCCLCRLDHGRQTHHRRERRRERRRRHGLERRGEGSNPGRRGDVHRRVRQGGLRGPRKSPSRRPRSAPRAEPR
jgi:type VI secretion system VgrG family protein